MRDVTKHYQKLIKNNKRESTSILLDRLKVLKLIKK